jgi:hypothetical protein
MYCHTCQRIYLGTNGCEKCNSSYQSKEQKREGLSSSFKSNCFGNNNFNSSSSNASSSFSPSSNLSADLLDRGLFKKLYEFANKQHTRGHPGFSITWHNEPIIVLRNPNGYRNIPYAFFDANKTHDPRSYFDIGCGLHKRLTSPQIKKLATTMLSIIRQDRMQSASHLMIVSDRDFRIYLALVLGTAACDAARGYTGLINTLAKFHRIANYNGENESMQDYIRNHIFPDKLMNFIGHGHAVGYMGSQQDIRNASQPEMKLTQNGGYRNRLKRDLDYLCSLGDGTVVHNYLLNCDYVRNFSQNLVQWSNEYQQSLERWDARQARGNCVATLSERFAGRNGVKFLASVGKR